jgi:iron complex transport system substrate-binding protein
MRSRYIHSFTGVLLAVCLLGACASDTSPSDTDTTEAPAEDTSQTTESEAAAAPAASTTYPFTFQDCGNTVTVNERPQSVLLTEAAGVSILDNIGALDAVTALVGEYPKEYYSDAVNERLGAITKLTSQTGSAGGVEISLETIIDAKPDLVIGYETETITRGGLAKAGINLVTLPPFCKTPPPVSFDSIYDQITFFGELFDKTTEAATAVEELRAQVTSRSAAPVVATGTTGAALFVSSDGSALYAYSKLGMVHPQMDVLGLTNPFADLPERVPEVSIEKIIDANPDVLILLYTDAKVSPEQITKLVTGLPGADRISAVSTGKVYPLLFNFSEPPSPLVVEGLARLSEMLKG